MVKIIIVVSGFFLQLIIISNCYCQVKPDALSRYIITKDNSFQWKIESTTQPTHGSYCEIDLTSQTWHNIVWKHHMIVYMPRHADYPNTVLLLLRHIENRAADKMALKIISDSTGTAAAVLYDVPNQPLFDGKEEDDLQAYTFSQFVKTGDETWPLLLPMTKSVIKAMEVIQDLATKQNNPAISKFVITGHSKRGHTAWLSAVVDKRIKGIIPIAIDVLNSPVQLPHHIASFGEYSTPSKATTDFLQKINTPRGKRLIEIIDPYSYKEHLTLPKLIVSATNDQFFATDALNIYWDSLREPKSILYLSNANHVSANSDPRINATAFAFVRAIAKNKTLPPFVWTFTRSEKSIRIRITTDSSAKKANAWISHSQKKDFRQAKWDSKPMPQGVTKDTGKTPHATAGSVFEIDIVIPEKGFLAIFGEVEFADNSSAYLLSTQMNIIAGSKK